jgi:multidrug efflux pump subunit AcrA (membrane-fusion protein)
MQISRFACAGHCCQGRLAARHALARLHADGRIRRRSRALSSGDQFSGAWRLCRSAITSAWFIRSKRPSSRGQLVYPRDDFSERPLDVKVPQDKSGRIEAGLKASLSLPQFPGKVFPAVVVSQSHAIDEKSETLLVELNVDNPDGLLQSGSRGEVQIDLAANP